MRSNCSGDRDRVRLVDRPDDVDESWLVLHAQAGSREHIERLVLIAQEFLAPRLRAMVAEPADADDVLQDVLFTICRRLWTLNDARLFRPWAHRIATRAAWKVVNRRRREHASTTSVDDLALPAPISESDQQYLRAMVERVSPASRIVLVLHYLEGKTLEATAAELGVAPGTVKSRLAYGLEQLRTMVK
jgi:RNA polymerase sigma-70 factor, ECF subfamily